MPLLTCFIPSIYVYTDLDIYAYGRCVNQNGSSVCISTLYTYVTVTVVLQTVSTRINSVRVMVIFKAATAQPKHPEDPLKSHTRNFA